VQRAEERTGAGEDEKCGLLSERPPFGSTDAATVIAAAVDGAVALLHELLGDPVPDASLHTTADDQAAAACQQVMVRRANKLYSAASREVIKFTRRALEDETVDGVGALEANLEDLLSSSSKIASTEQKLVKAVDRACGPVPDPDLIFPGGCADADLGNVETCAIAAARCQACLTVNTSSDLDLDCEQLDDGTVNGSCP
jgi:hypothetical protein